MRTTASADGTEIAYDRVGHGPPLIVVGGALQGRAAYGPAAAELARYLTVINYDRRGRGDSGDSAPYSVEREIEDIAALVDAVGGTAAVYGHSSGAALALAAAADGVAITSLILHEPPFGDGSPAEQAAERAEADHLGWLLDRCARAEVVRSFYASMDLPDDVVTAMAADPILQRHAPTLLYDYAVLGHHRISGRTVTEQAARVEAPTLVLVGGTSRDVNAAAGQQLMTGLPAGRLRVLAGHRHEVPPDILAPIVTGFVCIAAAHVIDGAQLLSR